MPLGVQRRQAFVLQLSDQIEPPVLLREKEIVVAFDGKLPIKAERGAVREERRSVPQFFRKRLAENGVLFVVGNVLK